MTVGRMDELKPTVGRMVYYKSLGSADGSFPATDRAAIVSDVRVRGILTEVRLVVMNPDGLYFTGWILQGQGEGQWDWMPF